MRTAVLPSYGLTQTVAPAAEPLALAEAKEWLRLEQGWAEDNRRIHLLIKAARGLVEQGTGRQLITATWRLTLWDFPYCDEWIRLPKPPLQSIVSVTYTDPLGFTQTLAGSEYQAVTDSLPGWLAPAYDKAWPQARRQAGSVAVTFTAGYGSDPASVPEQARQAVRFIVEEWYTLGAEPNAPVSKTAQQLIANLWHGGYA